MAELTERSILRVEGKDNSYAIQHLLGSHGIDYNQGSQLYWLPDIKVADNKDKLLRLVQAAVSVTDRRPIGFVLDANLSLQDRWSAITARLSPHFSSGKQ